MILPPKSKTEIKIPKSQFNWKPSLHTNQNGQTSPNQNRDLRSLSKSNDGAPEARHHLEEQLANWETAFNRGATQAGSTSVVGVRDVAI